jgi:broad specificity phosphatase PhoE
MKWRRFHKHQISEFTEILPDLILAGCVLHNICIDAGDVTEVEHEAMDDADAEDREAIRIACNRVMESVEAAFGNNAVALVAEGRAKRVAIYNYLMAYMLNTPTTLEILREAFGPHAFVLPY